VERAPLSVVRVSTPEERMDLAAVVDSVRRAAIDMVVVFCWIVLVERFAFYEHLGSQNRR